MTTYTLILFGWDLVQGRRNIVYSRPPLLGSTWARGTSAPTIGRRGREGGRLIENICSAPERAQVKRYPAIRPVEMDIISLMYRVKIENTSQEPQQVKPVLWIQIRNYLFRIRIKAKVKKQTNNQNFNSFCFNFTEIKVECSFKSDNSWLIILFYW